MEEISSGAGFKEPPLIALKDLRGLERVRAAAVRSVGERKGAVALDGAFEHGGWSAGLEGLRVSDMGAVVDTVLEALNAAGVDLADANTDRERARVIVWAAACDPFDEDAPPNLAAEAYAATAATEWLAGQVGEPTPQGASEAISACARTVQRYWPETDPSSAALLAVSAFNKAGAPVGEGALYDAGRAAERGFAEANGLPSHHELEELKKVEATLPWQSTADAKRASWLEREIEKGKSCAYYEAELARLSTACAEDWKLWSHALRVRVLNTVAAKIDPSLIARISSHRPAQQAAFEVAPQLTNHLEGWTPALGAEMEREYEEEEAWEREQAARATSPVEMAKAEAGALLDRVPDLGGGGAQGLANQVLMALPGLERETATSAAREALEARGLPFGPLEQAPPVSAAAPRRAATPFVLGDPSQLSRREWLYGQLLIRKELTATVAPGGVGKTTLAITEAVALASGRPLLGVPIEKPRRVWIWNGEEPEDEMRRRISAVCLYHGLTDTDLGGRLFFDNGHDLPIVLVEQSREGVKVFQPMVDALLEMLQEREIDVMFVDPFISTHNVAENETNAMQKAASSWKELAVKANVAISIAHHTRKLNGEEASMDSSRGASSFVDKVRIGRSLNVMTEKEAKEYGINSWERLGFISYGSGGKANMSARSHAKSWYRLTDVGLGNGNPLSPFAQEDRVGLVVAWEPPARALSIDPAALMRLRSLLSSGTWRPAPQSHNSEDWTGVAVAEAFGIDRSHSAWKQHAKAKMKMLERAGYLETEKRIGAGRTEIAVSAFVDPEEAEGEED